MIAVILGQHNGGVLENKCKKRRSTKKQDFYRYIFYILKIHPKTWEKENNNKKEIPRIGHSATVSGDRQIRNTRYSAAAAAHTDSTILVTRQRRNY